MNFMYVLPVAAVSIAVPAAGALAYVPFHSLPFYDQLGGNGLEVDDSSIRLAGATAGFTGRPHANGGTPGDQAYRWAPSLGTLDLLNGLNAGSPPNMLSVNASVSAINTVDVVVGTSRKYADGVDIGRRAVRWDAGSNTAVELGGLGTTNLWTNAGAASGINSGGTVVGTVTKVVDGVDVGMRAVRWDPGSTTAVELGTIGRTGTGVSYAQAWAVNDSGTIVGAGYRYSGNTPVGQRAIRWNAGSTTAAELRGLGTNAQGYSESWASAINATGITIGYADKYENFVYQGSRGVRWNANSTTATELGDLGDGTGGYANAISDDGTIVGFAGKSVGGVSVGARAVRWAPGATIPTQLAGFGTNASGNALSINSAGIIVGSLQTDDPTHRIGTIAVMWGVDGVPVDLNTLLAPDSGWQLFSARQISNANWISGVGLFDPDGDGPAFAWPRQFMMQVPEPTSAMVILSVVAMSTLRRSRQE